MMQRSLNILTKVVIVASIVSSLGISLSIPTPALAEESRARPPEGCSANEVEANTAVGPVCITQGTAAEQSYNSVSAPARAAGGVTLASVLAPIVMVSWAIFMIASFLLSIVGVVFNFAMQYLVFDFGKYFGNSEGMLLAWGVLRDIGNIILIFGFIFMGIATILDLHNFSARKALPRLVIFAVLLNFSLFIAEAVIDTSNLFAATLYKQGYAAAETCGTTPLPSTETPTDANPCAITQGVSGTIMRSAALTTVFNTGDDFDFASYMSNPLPYLLKFMGLALIVTTATLVLLAGAMMLIGRAVQLALLMVTSPIGFAGMAIPFLQKYAQDWWHRLINQALFAPVFLLLLLVALKLVAGLGELARVEGGLAKAFASNEPFDIGPIFFYILVMTFLILALGSAKRFGVWGADFATNAASSLTFGALARITNAGVGGAAYGLRRAQQATGFGGRAGQVAVNRILRPIETANLDLRRLPGVAGALGVAGVTAGAKPAEHATLGDMKHIFEDAAGGKEGAQLEARYKGEKAIQDLEANAHHGALKPEDERTLASLSVKQLETLHGIKEGLPALSQNLSTDQFADLMKSDKLTDVEKGRLMDGRFAQLRKAIAGVGMTDDDRKAEVKKWAAKDLEILARENAKAFEELVSATAANQDNIYASEQYEALVKSNALTNSQRQLVKDKSVAGRIEVNVKVGGAPALAGQLATLLKPKQKAQLSSTALTTQEVINTFTHQDLAAMMSRDELKGPDVQAIARIIRGAHPNSAAIQRYLRGNRNANAYWQ